MTAMNYIYHSTIYIWSADDITSSPTLLWSALFINKVLGVWSSGFTYTQPILIKNVSNVNLKTLYTAKGVYGCANQHYPKK